MSHKLKCKEFKHLWAKYHTEAENLKHYKAFDGVHRNYFTSPVFAGKFWGILHEIRDYCRAVIDLAFFFVCLLFLLLFCD
jgi:hypothetical protein